MRRRRGCGSRWPSSTHGATTGSRRPAGRCSAGPALRCPGAEATRSCRRICAPSVSPAGSWRFSACWHKVCRTRRSPAACICRPAPSSGTWPTSLSRRAWSAERSSSPTPPGRPSYLGAERRLNGGPPACRIGASVGASVHRLKHSRERREDPMNREQTTGEFFAAPPMAAPVLPWRPEYGTIDDVGDVIEVGGDVYVYSSPDYALDVNTVYALTPDGVVVLDTQLLPRHAEAVIQDIHARTDKPIRYVCNSHHLPVHVFGNPAFLAVGAELVSSYFTARMIDSSSF